MSLAASSPDLVVSERRRWLIMVTLVSSLIVVILDNTILNVALPSISRMAGVHVTAVIAGVFALVGMAVVLKWLPCRGMAVAYTRSPGAGTPAASATATISAATTSSPTHHATANSDGEPLTASSAPGIGDDELAATSAARLREGAED